MNVYELHYSGHGIPHELPRSVRLVALDHASAIALCEAVAARTAGPDDATDFALHSLHVRGRVDAIDHGAREGVVTR